jgi:hypothetical protein
MRRPSRTPASAACLHNFESSLALPGGGDSGVACWLWLLEPQHHAAWGGPLALGPTVHMQ